MIYLDHAATSFHKPQEVAEAVYQALMGTGNSGRGVHGASLEASRLIHQTRGKIAQFFNVGDSSHVVFTANATESLNIAIQGLLKPGDHCVTSSLEHNSVLRPLYLMEKRGVELTVIETDDKGYLDLSKFEAAIQKNTKLIVLTHASNVLGNVIDIEKVGKICRQYGILFVVDASQTAGLIPIDMDQLEIDVLCCSGHKSLLGPQGIGLLCLREGLSLPPLKVGGTGMDSFSKMMPDAMPTVLEAGTLNTHGIAGLGAACDYLNDYGQSAILSQADELARRFVEGIKDLSGITLYADLETLVRTPVIALNLRDIDSGEVADELYERFGIATRAGVHCAPLVHKSFKTEEQGMVRFSFSHFNTTEEVDEAIRALRILEEETR